MKPLTVCGGKRKYWIKYYRDFSNTYYLCYTETGKEEEQAEAKGWRHITRKEAIDKCIEERNRRKEDQEFSGFADVVILPFSYNTDDDYWVNDPRMVLIGSYIVERSK